VSFIAAAGGNCTPRSLRWCMARRISVRGLHLWDQSDSPPP
jgi:hypothetical protein